MRRLPSAAAVLLERLCRPQRIGVFGHRGVGKTTLLTMLYRESVGGRLPGLRLAAANAPTANHLSDKILQLESGKPLPATLAETDLRFNLHHGTGRLELLMKDYQGEHVEVGRVEPIGQFLRDCDAVWLCLDAATVTADADRLLRQQEVEHLVEQYLAVDPDRILVTPAPDRSGRQVGRPVAMLLTKADLLGTEVDNLQELTAQQFAMVRHALQLHCPQNALFAVSSLGAPLQAATNADPASTLTPRNLADPLRWLATTLQSQDEARVERLWQLAPNDLRLLSRAVACFTHRYPGTPAAERFKKRLRQLRLRRGLTVAGASLAGAVALLVAGVVYDWIGWASLTGYQKAHAEAPAEVVKAWTTYQAWHPTRNFFGGKEEKEDRQLAEWQARAREQQYQTELAQLRREVDALALFKTNDDALLPKLEALRSQFLTFRNTYPEVAIDDDLKTLAQTMDAQHAQQMDRMAQLALEELTTAERQGGNLLGLVERADRILRDYPGSRSVEEVKRRRTSYLARLDDRDIEAAHNYSAQLPFNFQTRKEMYQRYLDKHPSGAFAAEARKAVAAVDDDWDKHDFRQIRDLYNANPADVVELARRCDLYAKVHPRGRFVTAARDLLRWTEQVQKPTEYRVTLVNGSVDRKLAHFFSRGPDLAVELEVAGVRYGPGPMTVNNFTPEWNYEFPRPIKWKLGDPVHVRVIDYDWKPRVLLDYFSQEGDLLGMKMLSGENWHVANVIRLQSTFAMPVLPDIE